MKKAITSKIFIFALSLFIVAILILFFVKWTSGLDERRRQAQYIITDEEVSKVVDEIFFGQVKKAKFTVPVGTEVCFFDSRAQQKRELLASNDSKLAQFPILRSILNPSDNINRNIVYIDTNSNKIVKQSWVPNICFDKMPYYSCVKSVGGSLDILFEGKGDCVTIHSFWKELAKKNVKNPDMYKDNPLFMTWDTDDVHSNWRNILSILVLTLETLPSGAVKQHPYTIIYNKTRPKNTSILEIIQQRDTNMSFIMGPFPIKTNKIYRGNINITNVTVPLYSLFWQSYEHVIVTSDENTDNAIKVAMGALGLNAPPLLYMDKSTMERYASILDNKTVFIFDNETLAEEEYDFILLHSIHQFYVNSDDFSVTDFLEPADPSLDFLSIYLTLGKVD